MIDRHAGLVAQTVARGRRPAELWRLGQVLESFPTASLSPLHGQEFFGRQRSSLLARVQIALMRDPRGHVLFLERHVFRMPRTLTNQRQKNRSDGHLPGPDR